VATAANLLWLGAQYVSFLLTYARGAELEAGVYHAFMHLSQPVLVLANAAWAVVLTHVAARWESRDPQPALATLETSYKAVAAGMMTLAVAALAAAPLWVRLLPLWLRRGLPALPGILMFFQAVVHLGVMTMLAKLREQPFVIVLAAAAGGAANAALGALWVDRFSWAGEGAAWAAGVGMYAGSAAVALAYFALARIRLRPATYAVMLSPAVLASAMWLPTWAPAAIWLGLCAAGAASGLLFSAAERAHLRDGLRRLGDLLRGRAA
jgi:hypothetical protein